MFNLFESDFITPKRKFEVKCNECGKKAIVPFKPVVGRKVFCKDCYSKQQSHNLKNSSSHNKFNTNFAWARRTKKFTGKREKKLKSIFHKE